MPKPRIPGSKLNPVEKDVLRAFEEGLGRWDVEREFLRAGFLRDLFLGNYGDWNPRRVVIEKANIAERLDMDHCDVLHPLCFFRCRFLNGISLVASTVPSLDLQGCRIESRDENEYVIVANGLKAMNVKLSNGFIAEGSVTLGRSNIKGQLICRDGRFERDLYALGLKALSVLLNRGFTAGGDVNLSSANIAGQLVCEGGKFGGKLLAQNLAAESVFFNGEFEAKSLVILSGSNITAQLVCVDGTFVGCDNYQGDAVCFLAQNLKAESVFLGGKFKGNGQVILNGSNVNGQLSCEGGEFEGDLLAEALKAKDVFLRKGFKVKGDVRLLGANISEELDCRDGTFGSALNLTDATIGVFHSNKEGWPEEGFLFLDGFRYRRLKRGAGDGAEAGLDWLDRMGDDFCPQPYEQLMSVYRRMGRHDWAREVGFELEKRRHREFKKNKKLLARIRKFVISFWKWLERFWWNRWSAILNVTIGYGYKPFRSLAWALSLWLAGTLAFGSAGLIDCRNSQSMNKTRALFVGVENRSKCSVKLIRPSDGSVLAAGGSIPEKYPRFVPIVYATEALFPVFDFGQLDKWHLGNIWLSILRWTMTGGGTVLLAILALFGVGVLGPQRWRGGEGE